MSSDATDLYLHGFGNNMGDGPDDRNSRPGVMAGWPAWRAAVRIARRDAWRHKGRSLLVVVMIALPVLGLTAADLIARSMQLTPVEKMTRTIGQADAGFILTARPVPGQTLDPMSTLRTLGTPTPGEPLRQGTARYVRALHRVLALLPPGTTVTTSSEYFGTADANSRLVHGVDITTLDVADPISRGILQVVSGRAPRDSDEVAINHPLAASLHTRLGGTIRIRGRDLRITGIARNPNDLGDPQAVAPPEAFDRHSQDAAPMLLVNTHGTPVDWPTVRRLNAVGALVTGRDAVLHPPATGPEPVPVDTTSQARTIGLATVAVGLAILEVVLLAGAAFAVGARRQTRDLALIATTGADQQQIAGVVLAGGLVLGAAGAVAGVALGVAASGLALPEVEHLAGRVAGGFHVHPVELAAIALIGVITGVLAATLPARTAGRTDVVAALTGRRRAAGTPRSVPTVGIVMAVLGALLAGYAATPPAKFWLVLAGLVVGELGFVVCAPAIVGAAGRLARWAPLPMRLALRDASRHRGRTGPAVAAIIAAVAGITAIALYAASQGELHRQEYQPTARIGQASVHFRNASVAAAKLPAVTAALRSDAGEQVTLSPVPTAYPHSCVSCTVVAELPDPSCRDASACNQQIAGSFTAVAVGGPSTIRTILGHDDPAADGALAAGRAVAFIRFDGTRPPGPLSLAFSNGRRSPVVPADFVSIGRDQGALAGAVIPPATADRLGLRVRTTTFAVDTARPLDPDVQHRINATLRQQHTGASLTVESGYDASRDSYLMLALLAGALIVVLGTTGVVTGLSAAESRPDLATFAAVGAAPRTRRALAAGQAGTVALLGTVTGVVSGAVSASAILSSYGAGTPFTVPWWTVVAMAFGLPLLAGLLVGGLTRGRLPVERRWA